MPPAGWSPKAPVLGGRSRPEPGADPSSCALRHTGSTSSGRRRSRRDSSPDPGNSRSSPTVRPPTFDTGVHHDRLMVHNLAPDPDVVQMSGTMKAAPSIGEGRTEDGDRLRR